MLLVAWQIHLLPIKFEAGLHIPEQKSARKAKFIRLSEVVTKAVELNAPAKTYSTFIDMILCAVSEGKYNAEPLIPIDTGANILYYTIKVAKGTDGYSVLLMSRWIRCLVQLVLGSSELESKDENLKLVEGVVEQALTLAAGEHAQERDPENHDYDANMPHADVGEAYPAEELEWLATTLFNLGVDCYASQREELGKEWAKRAVELANVLQMSKGVVERGRLLAGMLKTKMTELGWDV